jgi:hypothetical protein
MTMKKYKGTNNDLQNNTQKAKIEQHEPYDVVGFFQDELRHLTFRRISRSRPLYNDIRRSEIH